MKFSKKYLSNIALLALVAANAIPLWGVLFLDWDWPLLSSRPF